MTSAVERFLEGRVAELRRSGLLREPDGGERREGAMAAARRLGVAFVDASSNDYLGLADGSDVSRETGVQEVAVGAGASRLIHGSRDPHQRLERALAEWVRLPAALLLTSGYAANVGLLTALGTAGSVIVSDRLNHASTIDGCRLSRATTEVVPHLALDAFGEALAHHRGAAARWVVVESCYSMDGDGPDLRALRALCDEHQAGLIVDEAHSLGVFGAEGAGRCAEATVVPDVLVGTLGKSVGAQGAFIAGSRALRTVLWNDARSFVFSTAPSPRLAATAVLHVERTRTADDRRARLRHLIAEFRDALLRLNVAMQPGLEGPIVPIVVGDNARVLAVVSALEAEGILAQGIRPPTVPTGSARLRLTVTAAWPDGAPGRVAEAVQRALNAS